MAEAKKDTTPDFHERQLDPALGHSAVRFHLPDRVPTRFRNPGPYLMAACKKKFQAPHLLHAFAHERLIILICSDNQTAASVRSFGDDLLARMVEDTKIFRLRLDGTAALSKALVTELTAKLGQPQSVEMKGSDAEHYGDHAFLTTRAPIDWQWPKKLHFRAYGHDMAVRLSLATGSPNASPSPVPGHEAASGGAQGHSDDKRLSSADGRAGGDVWQVVKAKSRVAKAELCRDFARGVCTRDDKCIFRHSKEACRDAVRGRCTRGSSCRFEHPVPAPATRDVMSRPPAPRDAGSNRNDGAPSPHSAKDEPQQQQQGQQQQ